MGQRLNTEVIINGKGVANSYMHWSAYTMCALGEAIPMVDAYNELKELELPDEVLAVKVLECNSSMDFATGETTNAGVSKASLEYLKEKYPEYKFNEAKDRNAGLIGVVEEDLNSTRSWAEGIMILNLDTEKIDVSSMVMGMGFDEWLEEKSWEDDFEIDDLTEEETNEYRKKFEKEKESLTELPYDELSNIPFDELRKTINILNDINNHKFKSKDERYIWSFIE